MTNLDTHRRWVLGALALSLLIAAPSAAAAPPQERPDEHAAPQGEENARDGAAEPASLSEIDGPPGGGGSPCRPSCLD